TMEPTVSNKPPRPRPTMTKRSIGRYCSNMPVDPRLPGATPRPANPQPARNYAVVRRRRHTIDVAATPSHPNPLSRSIRTLSIRSDFSSGADGETRTPTAYATAPSRQRVYQFHHVGAALSGGIASYRAHLGTIAIPTCCLCYFGTSPALELPPLPAGATD